MGVVNKPYTYSANTTISASQVNANFDTVYNEVNGALSAANLASDAVTTAKIADSNVTTAKINDSAVTTAKINDAAVTPAKLVAGTGTDWAWQDWTPTIGGFSSAPTGGVYRWRQIGKTVHLAVRQPNNGTSNATDFTLTLPVTAATKTDMVWFGSVFDHVNSGSAQTAVGRVQILSAATSCSVLRDAAGASWTNSGNKRASFEITYEAA